MTRSECRYCGRHDYADGKCYAESRAGRPIETYNACDWARKIKKNNHQKHK